MRNRVDYLTCLLGDTFQVLLLIQVYGEIKKLPLRDDEHYDPAVSTLLVYLLTIIQPHLPLYLPIK